MGLKKIDFGKKSGFRIPRVNIGGMRFPKDEDEAVELIRYALDAGMTYIDTSRGYGASEIKIGKAMKDGFREKAIISTKSAPWVKKIEDTDDGSADSVLRRIEESMKRLDIDYLDFYQVWNIHKPEHWEIATRKGGFVDGIRKARDRGLVGHIGFTSHDSVENLLKYLDNAEWCEVLLLTYNLMNRTYEPVIQKAKEKGIGTIIMNPVGGGKFANNSPAFKELVEELGCSSLADLAIRWVLSNPSVDTIISGIGRKSDVDDSIGSAERELFTPEQVQRINEFIDSAAPENVGFCTKCGYCSPCPNDVHIMRTMEAIYLQRYLGFVREAEKTYNSIGDRWIKHKNAFSCTGCGVCVEKCTQHLDIPAEMDFAKKTWPNPPKHEW
jgi:predicted aldo/keto reductase-like oxidoreductase